MRVLTDADKAAVQQEIEKNRAALEKLPGFIAAEPGFPLVDGQFVKEPAVIVLVKIKKPESELLPEERAPRQLGPYRVSVAQADPLRQLLASEAESTEAMRTVLATKATYTYERIEGNPIDKTFELKTPLLCHLGPDAGWPVLKPFLEATEKTLTVAMYDFNADYIAKTFMQVVKSGVETALSWDNGMTAAETEIRKKLRKLDGLSAGIVQCGNGYRFASAYHEKVAVRDHSAFWLSSGNWSLRSQPDIDPVNDAKAAKGMYSKGNREWHVISQDAKLAKVFEKYITRDVEQSQEEAAAGDDGAVLAVGEAPRMPDVLVPLASLQPDTTLATWTEPIEPQTLPAKKATYSVQPVLTPDNYLQRVSELLSGAEQSLYLQFAYITWSDKPEDKPFREMLKILADKSYEDGFDLRIIMGNNSAAEKIRKLVENGFNERVFRVQGSVHNKGIVADGARVLVSSTNWSGDGVLRNRDAGLIIDNEEIAQYFQDAFINDWDNRAASQIPDDPPVALALDDEPVPQGMVRMSWRDWHGE